MVDMSLHMKAEGQGEIPSVFCWTKMGAEAGQGLDAILHRKELERAAGNGSFAWGIGNSLGNSTSFARQQSPTGEVDVLFTPMKSAPKAVDVSPSQLLLWLYYESSSGAIKTLPEHMLVTSRWQEGKRSHYALLCHSTEEISERDLGGFHSACVRNLVSMNPVGASQVTSMVRYQTVNVDERPYRVSFRAKLYGEGFVKLVEPIVMDNVLLTMYNKACASETPLDWHRNVSSLKQHLMQTQRLSKGQEELFE